MEVSKWIIALVGIYGGLGGIMFDAVMPATSRQHLWNPAWPPHAKLLLAPFFPGTAWSDPEFEAANPRPLGMPVQKFLSALAIGLIILAILNAVL